MSDPIKCPCCGDHTDCGVLRPDEADWWHCWGCGADWCEGRRVQHPTRIIPCPHLRTTALRCQADCSECHGKGEITVGVVQ